MTAPETNSSAVVYSFAGRWEQPIREGLVRVFFRKRRPVRVPNRIFFYVGVPVKAIIGFAEVQGISELDLPEALAIRDEGAISADELSSYIGQNGRVNAIRISKPTLFVTHLELRKLNDEFHFNPPQSFSIMSDSFEAKLLGLAK